MKSRSSALSAPEAPALDEPRSTNGSRGRPSRDARPDSVGLVRRLGRVIARTAVMHELFDTLDRLAPTDLNLVLLGETGVAKDLLGHAIHERSGRKNGPYVVFDCHAVSAKIESELLGCEPGGGLPLDGARSGALGRAHGGTLFLDRVDRLPFDLQSRLRRALDEPGIGRGDGSVGPIDARIIAATHLNLSAEVTAGRFRKDLFYRLAGSLAQVPSLRQRRNDVLALKTRVANDLGLDIESFPLGGQRLWLLERAAIRQTLKEAGGDKASAARTLGIGLSTLYAKLQKHDL